MIFFQISNDHVLVITGTEIVCFGVVVFVFVCYVLAYLVMRVRSLGSQVRDLEQAVLRLEARRLTGQAPFPRSTAIKEKPG
jgi:hypothetical protein